MFKELLDNLKKVTPLVHNITNYVTVNDVANILLAVGASPIMADDITDAKQITAICTGLNINIGTLNAQTTKAMISTGIESNKLNHPTILDPVGVGANEYRTNFVKELLAAVKFDVIRGNISEIKAIANNTNTTRGVDANEADKVTTDNLDSIIAFAKKLSEDLNSVIAITGAIDIVCDSKKAFIIKNGRKEMSKITGTGCQLSALITAFVSANQDKKLEATAAAVAMMGLAGEIGFSHLQKYEGNSTYRNRIIDAINNMTGDELENGAKYEIK